jgi:hypothetical protein
MTAPTRVRPRVVDAAYRSSALPAMAAAAARIVVNGVWLGALSDDEFTALDERYYATTDLYRTEAWNQRGLFEWEKAMIDAHFPATGRVAVIACGGGREVVALLARGYDAVGYESHPDLVAYGRGLLAASGHGDRVRPVARNEFPRGDAPFDAIVVGWGAYSLIHGRDRREAMLTDCAAGLAADGRVLLSFFQGKVGRELRWIRALANVIRRFRAATPVELGDTLAPNRVHVFSRDELVAEVRAAHLEPMSYWTSSQPGEPIAYGCVVARRS